MTLQDWGALGEVVGGVAIIVSLVYVGLQVRQSTQAARAATSQSFAAQYSTHMELLTRPELRDIFWRGLTSMSDLPGNEQVAFVSFLNGVLRMFESFYLQQREGTFDTQVFDSWMVQLCDLFGNEGVREYWAIRKHQFTNEFVALVDESTARTTPRPMYPTETENQ